MSCLKILLLLNTCRDIYTKKLKLHIKQVKDIGTVNYITSENEDFELYKLVNFNKSVYYFIRT